MGEWDPTSYAGKDTILRVVRQEAERFFALAGEQGAWERSTPCTEWSVRDVVGHIVDTTEGYFTAFDAARSHADVGAAIGLPSMQQEAGRRATRFRDTSQQALLERLRTDFDKMMELLAGLGPEDWTGLMVPHAYMGPLPASFFAAGQLMDYTVHSWDIADGSGRAHAIAGEAADLLVPYMFVVWQSTIKAQGDKTPLNLGIRVAGGHNAGEFRVSVTPEGMTYQTGALDDLPCVLEFDAASLVLATYGRCNTGTVRGDVATANRYLNLFFRI